MSLKLFFLTNFAILISYHFTQCIKTHPLITHLYIYICTYYRLDIYVGYGGHLLDLQKLRPFQKTKGVPTHACTGGDETPDKQMIMYLCLYNEVQGQQDLC